MICKNCNYQNPDEAKFCIRCGMALNGGGSTPEVNAPTPGNTPFQGNYYDNPTAGNPNEPPYQTGSTYTYGSGQPPVSRPQKSAHGMEVAGLVLGIISIICCCTFIGGIGCGIAAILLSIFAKNREDSTTMSTCGLILGIAGVALSVISIIAFITTPDWNILTNSSWRLPLEKITNSYS